MQWLKKNTNSPPTASATQTFVHLMKVTVTHPNKQFSKKVYLYMQHTWCQQPVEQRPVSMTQPTELIPINARVAQLLWKPQHSPP